MTEQPPPPPAPGAPDAAAPPVCPRHPDRVSYVRCQRCGRPACPECQRPAAVGVQCVDCVREAARTAPRTTTAVGGRVRRGRPVVTWTLIGICVASFVLQLATRGAWTEQWAFSAAIGAAEPWRFLTTAFLHATNVTHILFNMWALWVTGQFLEPVLGRARFLALCALSAVGGSVGYLLLAGTPADDGWYQGVVGASGMVFGLFGAMVPVLRRLGADAAQAVGLIAVNAVIGFVLPGIAWQAHLGGLVVGLVLGWGFARAPRGRQRLVGWVLPLGMAVLLVALAVGKYTSTGWLAAVGG
ncbi:rhomboid family intramembrane serine protease [Puerhibacterium puerhi]|uniref:rhomboid family intramembrane serine protease n=1 Tax=Puerhibacterium puerhi TaxID=2692623 RepID=UPI001357E4C0|nr:rhomboid family intramembrane serine protease [Puerhibacterium puerhi]